MKDIDITGVVLRTIQEHGLLPNDADSAGSVAKAMSTVPGTTASTMFAVSTAATAVAGVVTTVSGVPTTPGAPTTATKLPIVLMVSGGSDSVALARLMPALYPQASYTVLHINHMLRGVAADEDERFVVDLARELGIPCELRRFDVAALAANSGGNIEEVGRKVRYYEANKLLDELCVHANIDPSLGHIATAHTRDDRVETFFMRAIVGGGAGSLSSIPYQNGRVIRPLLDLSRKQLREWLQPQALCLDEGLKDTAEVDSCAVQCELWREDASNDDTGKLRAFVRHELIPLARTRNPDLLTTVARTLDNLTLDDRLLTGLSDAMQAKLWSQDENGAVIIQGALFNEDPALIRRIIHRACKKVLPAGERITSFHVEQIARLGSSHGFAIDLPGGARVHSEYGKLKFVATDAAATDALVDHTWYTEFKLGETCELSDGRHLSITEVDSKLYATDPLSFVRKNSSASHVFIDAHTLRSASFSDDTSARKLSDADSACNLRKLSDADNACNMHKLSDADSACNMHKLSDADNVYNARGSHKPRSAEHPSSSAHTLHTFNQDGSAQKLAVAGALGDPSFIISRIQPGDSFCPLGMNGHRKLVSDVLINKKIPRQKRVSQLKLSTLIGGVPETIWLVDIQLDERFKVSHATRAMFSILIH